MRRKIRNAAIAASLIGGAGVLSMPMTAFAEDTSTAATAQATAKSPAQWAKDALKGLVDKGTITQEQSDAVAQALQDARPPGGHGPGGPGGKSLSTVATALGMSESDLRTELTDGKTIAAVAQAHNVDVQKVIDALVAEENSRIDQQVTDGRLTQDQANERKANTVERVTNQVNNTRPEGGFGRGGGPRGGGAPDGNAPDATAPSGSATDSATDSAAPADAAPASTDA